MQGTGLDRVDHKPLSVFSDCLFTFTSPAQCLEWEHVLTPMYADLSTQGHIPTSMMRMSTLEPASQAGPHPGVNVSLGKHAHTSTYLPMPHPERCPGRCQQITMRIFWGLHVP